MILAHQLKEACDYNSKAQEELSLLSPVLDSERYAIALSEFLLSQSYVEETLKLWGNIDEC